MDASNLLLQPGVSIKPNVNLDNIKKLISEIYGLKCVSIKTLNGYDDNNYHIIVEDSSKNDNIVNICHEGYILKIINSLDSKKTEFFDAQNTMMLHLGRNGIACPKPVQTIDGKYYIHQNFSSGNHLVRLLEFISGSILHQIPCTYNLFYQIGEYVAKMDKALETFHHSAYNSHKMIWMMEFVPQLSQFLYAVTDPRRKRLVEEIIKQFASKVLSVNHLLEKGMIHGDVNEQNVVVEKRSDNNEWGIKAILDLGDTQFNCYLYELAITMTYMMIQGKSLDVGGYVLAGYSSVKKLPEEEYQLLKICIAARLCQSLVIGAYSSLQDPDNKYILVTAKPGWILLEQLWQMPDDILLSNWRRISQTNNKLYNVDE